MGNNMLTAMEAASLFRINKATTIPRNTNPLISNKYSRIPDRVLSSARKPK